MAAILITGCQVAAAAAAPATFTNPIVASGADPWVIQREGQYLFCQSGSGRGVWVSKSARLEDIGKAPRVNVWRPPRGTTYSREIWAPELHYLKGKWYIYVAADDGDNAHHRICVLEGTSQDPQQPFEFRGKLALPGDRWAIDGTVLQHDERLYFVWSGWDGAENVAQNLYIASMSDPLTISSDRVCISRPEHDWEEHGRPLVNEGPEALRHDGKVFIIYSASGSWGDDYCLGQLTWTGGDMLQPQSWVKKAAPVFSRAPNVFGPGHASFVRSPDGTQDWIVYHAAKYRGGGWNRSVRMQQFSWNPDGSPNFGAPVSTGVPLAVPSSSGPARSRPGTNLPSYVVGADISWVPQQESEGRRFSVDGVERDPVAILKDHGFNTIRLRLFYDPAAPGGYSAGGFCGLESTLAMARRVKAAGLKLLLDFHYSDTWADPAHQTKPAAWRDLDFPALTNALYWYTRDTLTNFAHHGLTPDIVQVGNEISNGLLWPDGKSDRFDDLAALLRAGVRGVRDGVPPARVMLHLAWGGQNEKSRWFLDNALRRGVEFDLLGQSYYPRWHGTLADLRANLTDLATRYPQEIVVVEYSTPYVLEVNEIVRSLPNGKGRGACIWEPTHPGHGNLFDKDGKALPALEQYHLVASNAPPGEAAAAPATFQNPLNPGPDPWMVYHDGNYYLTTTQGDAVRMWKSHSLGGLKTVQPVTVWRDADPTRSRGIWAPEFHFISNRWYLYYTATSSDNQDRNHRMHVLESAGTDPLGPYTYKGRLVNPTNDHYAIDGSVFQNTADGSWYFLWAAQPGHVLYIARLANPWTLDGHGVSIPASGFGCAEVREAPVVLHRNGRFFLVYSACDTGKPDYKLGMLIASETSDLMDPKSWQQFPQPVLERNDTGGVFGPGHNGFFRSPDAAEDWIVYHAKTSSAYTYRGRTTRVQKFTWNEDGTPNFGTPLPLSAVLQEP